MGGRKTRGIFPVLEEFIFWDVSAKRQVLERFCKSCEHCNSGKKTLDGIMDIMTIPAGPWKAF